MTATLQLFATCAKGLEPLLFDELQQLGLESVQQTVAGCRFSTDLQGAYRVCLWSRLASRVLLQLGQCEVGRDLQRVTAAIAQTPWHEHFDVEQTFVVSFTGQNQQIRHTQFGAQMVKDGVVDHFREAGLGRPSVDRNDPNVRIHAHLHREQLTWYYDLSGEALHRRGYRLEQGAAPVREILGLNTPAGGIQPVHAWRRLIPISQQLSQIRGNAVLRGLPRKRGGETDRSRSTRNARRTHHLVDNCHTPVIRLTYHKSAQPKMWRLPVGFWQI